MKKKYKRPLTMDNFVNMVSDENSDFHIQNTVSFKREYIEEYLLKLISNELL